MSTKSYDAAPVNLLMGYDGSDHAQAAVTLICDAFKINQQPLAQVTLLAVFTPLMAGDLEPFRDSLESATQFLIDNGFDAKSEFLMGYPAEKIVEYSENLNPDLVILGAKGLRSALGILLGGVAQQVVEYSTCPILVVRAPYTGMQRIVLISDGSEHSQEATEFLGRFPNANQSEVHVLHILPPLPLKPSPSLYARSFPVAPEVLPVYPYEPSEEELSWQREEEQHGKSILDDSIHRLKKVGVDASPVLLRGDAAREIITFAENTNANLIVCGSRGLSQFRGWLLGSVSRKLVHYSNCSVLVVKKQVGIVPSNN